MMPSLGAINTSLCVDSDVQYGMHLFYLSAKIFLHNFKYCVMKIKKQKSLEI